MWPRGRAMHMSLVIDFLYYFVALRAFIVQDLPGYLENTTQSVTDAPTTLKTRDTRPVQPQEVSTPDSIHVACTNYEIPTEEILEILAEDRNEVDRTFIRRYAAEPLVQAITRNLTLCRAWVLKLYDSDRNDVINDQEEINLAENLTKWRNQTRPKSTANGENDDKKSIDARKRRHLNCTDKDESSINEEADQISIKEKAKKLPKREKKRWKLCLKRCYENVRRQKKGRHRHSRREKRLLCQRCCYRNARRHKSGRQEEGQCL